MYSWYSVKRGADKRIYSPQTIEVNGLCRIQAAQFLYNEGRKVTLMTRVYTVCIIIIKITNTVVG